MITNGDRCPNSFLCIFVVIEFLYNEIPVVVQYVGTFLQLGFCLFDDFNVYACEIVVEILVGNVS